MISVHFQGKPFNITLIQVYALTSNAEEAEVEQVYESRQIGSGQTGHGKSEHRHSRNQRTKMDWNG